MDYLEFYGLEIEPFSSALINKFYFNSAQHQRALVRLMYAVDTMKGLAVLIGDLGTGKTTLARRMLDSLPEEVYESALLVIIHSGITADWLLSRIARQLGVEDPAPEKLKLLNQLYNRLIELHEEGKKAVVLIDEAQMLHSREIMEEFRGLLNLELPETKLITFVFFGLPEFEDYLHLDEPLAQRVALKCKLDSFNYESTEGYVNHRLRLAGAKTALFNDESLKLIHHFSNGIPRLINTICDNSLFEGYLMKRKPIEADLVQAVATDLGLAPLPKVAKRVPRSVPADVIQVSDTRRMAPRPPAPPPPPHFTPPAAYQEAPAIDEEPPMLLDPEVADSVTIEPVEDDPTPAASPYQPPDAFDTEPVNAPAGAPREPSLPQMPTEPPPGFAPEAPAATSAANDEIDAMFNGITEDSTQKPKPPNDIDDLLEGLEKK